MTSPYLPNRTKKALAIRCSGATMPMGELLLRVELVLQRVLQLFTLQLSTSTPSKNRTSETESMTKSKNIIQRPDCYRTYNKKTHVERAGSWTSNACTGTATNSARVVAAKQHPTGVWACRGRQACLGGRCSNQHLNNYETNCPLRQWRLETEPS